MKSKKNKSNVYLDRILIGIICIVGILIVYFVGKAPVIKNTTNKTISAVTVFPSATPTMKPENIIADFTLAKFRVIKVEKDPLVPYYIIVATERSQENVCGEGNQRCRNDTGCGSIYTSPVCYFFAEPDYVSGANAQTRYLGKLDGGSGFFGTDTKFTYVDTHHIQFSTSDGDVSNSTKQWQLNVLDGGITKLSEQHFYPKVQ